MADNDGFNYNDINTQSGACSNIEEEIMQEKDKLDAKNLNVEQQMTNEEKIKTA